MTKRKNMLTNEEVRESVFNYLFDCGVIKLLETKERFKKEVANKLMDENCFSDSGVWYSCHIDKIYNIPQYTGGIFEALTIRELSGLFIEQFLYWGIKYKDITTEEADAIIKKATNGEYEYKDTPHMSLQYDAIYQLQKAQFDEEQDKINQLKIAGKLL